MSKQLPSVATAARKVGAPQGPRQSGVRRAALLDAAQSLFIEGSIDSCTMDEIAARAGVGKGTLYHYFASKSALIDALRRRYADTFYEKVASSVEGTRPDAAARVIGWVTGTVETYFATFSLHDALFHSSGTTSRWPMGGEKVVLLLSDLLQAGVTDGVWKISNPHLTATVMFYGLHGAADEAIYASRPAVEVTRLLSEHFRNMLGIASDPSLVAIS